MWKYFPIFSFLLFYFAYIFFYCMIVHTLYGVRFKKKKLMVSSGRSNKTMLVYFIWVFLVFCFSCCIKTCTPSGWYISYFHSLCLFTELQLLRDFVGKNDSFLQCLPWVCFKLRYLLLWFLEMGSICLLTSSQSSLRQPFFFSNTIMFKFTLTSSPSFHRNFGRK